MNMERYVVTKSFMDRLTRKYYGVGSIYETSDMQRAEELMNGGYIAPENTEMASTAKAQAETFKAANQNAEAIAKAHQEAAKAAELKTVVNGKVVPLKDAQAAEASFNASVNQTGIQEAHNNATEPVQAGNVASQQGQSAQATSQNAAQANVRQANVQSGQAELEQHMNQAMNQQGGTSNVYTAADYAAEQQAHAGLTSNMAGTHQASQAGSQQASQAAQAEAKNAAALENANAAAHETAANNAQAAAEAKAKGTARAKKE